MANQMDFGFRSGNSCCSRRMVFIMNTALRMSPPAARKNDFPMRVVRISRSSRNPFKIRSVRTVSKVPVTMTADRAMPVVVRAGARGVRAK